MIGEKCECCGDEVLILKRWAGKNLCLDCYCDYKNKEHATPKNELANEGINTLYNKMASSSNRDLKGDRRCPNCGRIIPFDSVLCPYCGKRFEDFFR